MPSSKQVWDKLSPQVRAILEYQCSVVGKKPEDVPWDNDSWYRTFVWSEVQEKEFVEWLTEQFMKDKDIKGLLGWSRSNKRRARAAAAEWVWMYGWSTR